MGLKGINVNTAPEAEPHIYAEDDAAIYQSIFGPDGVSTIGSQCKATVLSNNKVRVSDGVICVGGHFARIPYGEYEDCEIANGQSGKNRNDIIVGKFVTTGTGGIDTMTCEVKQGTSGTTASDPDVTQEDVYKGGKTRELPLYRVKIEGLSIVAVERLFTVIPTNKDLTDKVNELNSNIMNLKPNVYHGFSDSSNRKYLNLYIHNPDYNGILGFILRYDRCVYIVTADTQFIGTSVTTDGISYSKLLDVDGLNAYISYIKGIRESSEGVKDIRIKIEVTNNRAFDILMLNPKISITNCKWSES